MSELTQPNATTLPDYLRTLSLDSPERTGDVARHIAPSLRAGDVLLLEGGLGAGKTHFARALIQTRLAAADVLEDVPSPTFTIVQTYEDGICEIWHTDLYRLASNAEIDELGLLNAFETAICLIEWPDRLGELAPNGALTCRFEFTDNPGCRSLTFSGDPDRWANLVAGL